VSALGSTIKWRHTHLYAKFRT